MDSPSVGLIQGPENNAFDLDSRFLVALPPASDLLLSAKHLFVLAVRCGLQ
jgi:hypothetical protein